jgi:hypothetical protein
VESPPLVRIFSWCKGSFSCMPHLPGKPWFNLGIDRTTWTAS